MMYIENKILASVPVVVLSRLLLATLTIKVAKP